MFKKISVQNVSYQILSNTVLASSKFSQNMIGKPENFKYTNALNVNTSGMKRILISSACLI